MATKKTTTVKAVTLDFSDVRERGNFNPRRRPAGEYRAKIVSVTQEDSKKGNPQLIFTIQVDGDRRASYPFYCGLDAKQLWKIRNLIVAAGLRAPEGRAKVDPMKLVNRSVGVFLDDDEYEGRVKSTVADVFPVSDGDFLNAGESSKKKGRQVEDDDEDDEDEDDEPEPPKKSSKKKAPEPEDDEDDDEEDDEEEPPAKKKAKPAKSKKKPPVDEDDEDEDDDEEDDEEPAPKKKSKKAPTKKSKKSKRDADDDDDEMDIDDL